ncbi:hypothetical protein GURASL_12140 [Geotalea uraniireducens]|uniref:Uncharacterized protein n=1 Tax=Geotalea uraniireducens TaxID=351604 RepID=A0ABN6VSZ5_9BACT|nr:hypothetical protein GURASL_12140 [Geotalea uraniireducens]
MNGGSILSNDGNRNSVLDLALYCMLHTNPFNKACISKYSRIGWTHRAIPAYDTPNQLGSSPLANPIGNESSVATNRFCS